MFEIKDLHSIQVGLASPEEIRGWSRGEVTSAETINYRTQKPEPDGLFCEKIFGPSKDFECHCGKYKKIRYSGITCDKCGVDVISKTFRRERMGHIELVSPCTHIWFLKGIPSRMGLILDISPKQLEEVVYFAAHIVLNKGDKDPNTILYYKEFLDERTAREVFKKEIQRLLDERVEKESSDAVLGASYVEKLDNPREAFDFFSTSAFIRKYTGAEFGEGASAIKQLLSEVDLDAEFEAVTQEMKKSTELQRMKLAKRLEVINAFRDSNQKPEWMVLDVIPVIPPDLRPMLQLDGGRFAASDLNELYRHVISRNLRLKRLIDMNAPYVILMNERRMLQEAVDALIDNGKRGKPRTGPNGRTLKSLTSGLKGKQGRFRYNLLGKRVDYSGRSVIAVGPDLKMYQCGLPREMAINLLRPFIAGLLMRDGVANGSKAADKIIDRRDSIVNDYVEEIISEHPVLLNRAPTLHRLSIQAFQPKLVEGRAIRLHPLVCTGFNADFDGDQMAVHVPLSKAAQYEALEFMLASNNILSPKDGKPIVTPGQDMIIGNYHLTLEESKEDFLERAAKNRAAAAYDGINAQADLEAAEQDEAWAEIEGKVFASVDEVVRAYELGLVHLHNRIAIPSEKINKIFGSGIPESVRGMYLITSVGKVIFNQIFPDDFPWINEIVNAKYAAKAGRPANTNDFSIGLETHFVPRGTNIKEYIASRPLMKPVAKKELGLIIDQVFHHYGTTKTSAVLDKIKDQGFKYSTVSSVTISISDIKDIDGKDEMVAEGQKRVDHVNNIYRKGLLSNEERHAQVVKIWTGVTEAVKNKIVEAMPNDKFNPINIMADSGARGSADNIKQLIGMKGLVMNPKNEAIELPIVSSYRDGMKVSEFFINTHGARKGGADTALKTADSGYLTRRLVDVSQDVIVREEDCHCDHGFKIREIRNTANQTTIVSLKDRLIGRFTMRDVVNPETGEVIVSANTMMDESIAEAIVKAGIKEVEIRSLFTCRTKDGVCQHCYGQNMATGKLVELGEAVGIMAAQSIGEPGTQLTMRVFHTGGMAGSDITQGLPRVQELVEARNPKGKALISNFAGEVTSTEDAGGYYKVTVKNDLDEKTYDTDYGVKLRVHVGDKIEAGAKITEGAIDPKELLAVSDPEKVEVYMLKEIHKVYAAQEIDISDKHLEIIVRQMLRKVLIIDGGDTKLLPGTKVNVERFAEENAAVLLEGKRPAVAQPHLLGITKAALETDSFLSAASFQETTKVLTDASIKGKTDILHGLKENVIAGKLIPAGTGLYTPEQEEERFANFDVDAKMAEVKDQYIEAHDRLGQ